MISDVEVRNAGPKGKGVFALRDFREGEFIFRRRQGPPLTTAAIARLSDDDRRHLCELDWEHCAVLFPPGCYLNHSCEPNAMRSGVKVFAWREIQASAEITIDYRLNAFDDADRWHCVCGHCSGQVTGSFFSLDEARAARYLRYAPRFIQMEYRSRRARIDSMGTSSPGQGLDLSRLPDGS